MAYQQKSVYRRGADDGLFFGVYLIALFFATAYSLTMPFVGLLSTILMLAVPVVIYRFLRRAHIERDGKSQFSELWLHGIVIFFCGGLIVSVVALIYMKWFEPNFIVNQAKIAIQIWEEANVPQAGEMAKVLNQAIEQKMIPTPINVVIEMLWLQVFTGSLLSMLLSAIIKSIKIKRHI